MPDSRVVLLEILVDRMSRGDHEAFAKFYDLTSPTAWRLARAATASATEAEAAMLGGYAGAWTAARFFPTAPHSPMSWLLCFIHSTARPSLNLPCAE